MMDKWMRTNRFLFFWEHADCGIILLSPLTAKDNVDLGIGSKTSSREVVKNRISSNYADSTITLFNISNGVVLFICTDSLNIRLRFKEMYVECYIYARYLRKNKKSASQIA